MSKNNITGDEIKSRAFSEQGRKNWDKIFLKKSGIEWAKQEGIRILDDDGWRYNDGVDLNTPITEKDYFQRRNQSTILYPEMKRKS